MCVYACTRACVQCVCAMRVCAVQTVIADELVLSASAYCAKENFQETALNDEFEVYTALYNTGKNAKPTPSIGTLERIFSQIQRAAYTKLTQTDNLYRIRSNTKRYSKALLTVLIILTLLCGCLVISAVVLGLKVAYAYAVSSGKLKWCNTHAHGAASMYESMSAGDDFEEVPLAPRYTGRHRHNTFSSDVGAGAHAHAHAYGYAGQRGRSSRDLREHLRASGGGGNDDGDGDGADLHDIDEKYLAFREALEERCTRTRTRGLLRLDKGDDDNDDDDDDALL